ncbi:hypothetical protein SEVIR_6G035050v4 [Setaria viridis]
MHVIVGREIEVLKNPESQLYMQNFFCQLVVKNKRHPVRDAGVGDMGTMCMLFDAMPRRDDVPWTAMIRHAYTAEFLKLCFFVCYASLFADGIAFVDKEKGTPNRSFVVFRLSEALNSFT